MINLIEGELRTDQEIQRNKDLLELLEKAKAGDRSSAYKLWLKYIKKWAREIVSGWSSALCEADKEDLISEIREKFVKKIQTLIDPLRIKSWSISLIRNTCIDNYRKKREQKKHEIAFNEQFFEGGLDLAKQNEREKQASRLFAIIENEFNNLNIPEREKNCFALALEGLHPKDIGEKLGIDARAVHKSTGIAFKKLKERIGYLVQVDPQLREQAESVLGRQLIDKFLRKFTPEAL